jgi:hypothetical protein
MQNRLPNSIPIHAIKRAGLKAIINTMPGKIRLSEENSAFSRSFA